MKTCVPSARADWAAQSEGKTGSFRGAMKTGVGKGRFNTPR